MEVERVGSLYLLSILLGRHRVIEELESVQFGLDAFAVRFDIDVLRLGVHFLLYTLILVLLV